MVDVLRQCLQDCFEATQSESDNYHPTFILSLRESVPYFRVASPVFCSSFWSLVLIQ